MLLPHVDEIAGSAMVSGASQGLGLADVVGSSIVPDMYCAAVAAANLDLAAALAMYVETGSGAAGDVGGTDVLLQPCQLHEG